MPSNEKRSQGFVRFVGLSISGFSVSRLFILSIICSILVGVLFIYSAAFVRADTASDLQAKINARNTDIANLEKEISSYQKQIDTLGTQADTLSSTIKSLDLTQKKLAADISLTLNKIDAKNLEIEELGTQINGKETQIEDDRRVISHALTLVNQSNQDSIPALLLGGRSLGATVGSFDQLANLESTLVNHVNDLRLTKVSLESNKMKSEQAKADLISLNNKLSDQRKVVIATQKQQSQLLSDTKESESQYQKLLANKNALKNAFEKEILQYEIELKNNVDPSKLPHTGSGVLAWPLDQIKITQYFGNTDFSTANPQIYNGSGHNGVDFKASIGTPVKAALTGTVLATGDTGILPSCYSFGRWIMIKHQNGLSTLYAHLSLINVNPGQPVATGEVIGYTGNTGVTTGPHLHFGVYATQGVKIAPFPSSSLTCPNILIPFASLNAYLNPLSYL